MQDIQKEIRLFANQERAEKSFKYLQAHPGGYGEGDLFLGLTVPESHKLAKKFKTLPLKEVLSLLKSPYHEERGIALMILELQFEKADTKLKEKIYRAYMKHKKYANNWDLIDGSAPGIAGAYLFDKDRQILHKLARSKSLWDRRLAILSSYYFIRQKDYSETLKLAEILLSDSHDLIHKAVGWMLREVGNRDLKTEIKFLDKHSKKMPRTMLRYAIEKFPEKQRQFYLKK